MTSLDDRRQLVQDSVNIRLNRLEHGKGSGGSGVPRGYFVFSLLMIPVSVFSGMAIMDYSYLLSLDDHSADPGFSYSIEGYEINFVSPEENSDMKDAYGFSYRGRTDDIFIRKSLLLDKRFEQVKRTCEHELLHNLGIRAKHHDLISDFEKQIDSPVCEDLMERIR